MEKGTLFFSNDGGVHWNKQDIGTSMDLERILFLHPDSGYIVGEDGFITVTTDQGNTWLSQQPVISD